jgi:asparagine synthase (glutamine-hydrolysing)
MCGIAGYFSPGETPENLKRRVETMARTLIHRGPDTQDSWADARAGLAFGHTRLSILDLSAEGAQPMSSADGRYTIAYNGEIYNHNDLRGLLGKGQTFRGSSDTETLLTAINIWGIEKTLRQANGMFAFALWDAAEQQLTLARDRMGEKPLYFGWHNGAFLFASELKAFRSLPEWPPQINSEALAAYLHYSCVPAPNSIFKGIYKLLPGSTLVIRKEHARTPKNFSAHAADATKWGPRRYWSAAEAAQKGLDRPFSATQDEALEQLDTLLRDSVAMRMHADVPLGAFLSGGIDSSSVVALMQAQTQKPVHTFTIGFSESDYDEAVAARKIATHLHTQHTELYVSPKDARAVIPQLPAMYDEPFADSSQIPTYLLSQLAKKDVTVALSGDGGDEAFGGYTRHVWGERIWPRVSCFPQTARAGIAGLLRSVKPETWNRFGPLLAPLTGPYGGQGRFGDKMHKVAEVLAMEGYGDLYERLVSSWPAPPLRTNLGINAKSWSDTTVPPSAVTAEGMILYDQTGYLPDDILVKVDRATMACSLEGRMPFLDHRIIEFGWRLPLGWKVSRNGGKLLLKKMLARYVPTSLFDRPKMGFGLPIESWLRGPLRDWAESLLSAKKLDDDGFLATAVIRKKWQEHLSGRHNWHGPLWTVLMFQAWRDAQKTPVHD